MARPTADLCDELGEELRVLAPVFASFGGREALAGPVFTLRVAEDNALVCSALETAGGGRVLAADADGIVVAARSLP